MEEKKQTRRFPMSDGDLISKANLVSANVNRDLAQFNTRNVTGTSTLDALTETFDNTPTDEELLGFAASATIAKNALAEQVKSAIRTIRNMAKLQFGTESNYVAFGFSGMAALNNNGLCRLVGRVVRVATVLLSGLSQQGLTQAQLDALAALRTSFNTSIEDHGAATENRTLQTGGRVAAGNTLWSEMLRLCSIGKTLYAATDAIKYKEYVLWEKPVKKAKREK